MLPILGISRIFQFALAEIIGVLFLGFHINVMPNTIQNNSGYSFVFPLRPLLLKSRYADLAYGPSFELFLIPKNCLKFISQPLHDVF